MSFQSFRREQELSECESTEKQNGASVQAGTTPRDHLGLRVGEGRWLCGLFSCSLGHVPRSVGFAVQVFDVLLHPGIAGVGADLSPLFGMKDDPWHGAQLTGPIIISYKAEWDFPRGERETAGSLIISWLFTSFRVEGSKSEEEGQGNQAAPHPSGG